MLLIKKEKQLKDEITNLRKFGKKINFIPTMGNLHSGHLSLVEKAKKKDHVCLVSIFVNQLQFNDKVDFRNYPRTIEKDQFLLSEQKADILFLPNSDFISKNISNYNLGDESRKLCGKDRKGHFLGVVSVILRFLKLIEPDYMFLGEKDFQQTIIINKLINFYNFKTKIKVLPTIRNSKGIAISSRNQFIKNEVSLIQLLPQTLIQIKKDVENGGFEIKKINHYKELLEKKGIEKVNYLEILKVKNLEHLNQNYSMARIFISATISGVRLIDNILIERGVILVGGKVEMCD